MFWNRNKQQFYKIPVEDLNPFINNIGLIETEIQSRTDEIVERGQDGNKIRDELKVLMEKDSLTPNEQARLEELTNKVDALTDYADEMEKVMPQLDMDLSLAYEQFVIKVIHGNYIK